MEDTPCFTVPRTWVNMPHGVVDVTVALFGLYALLDLWKEEHDLADASRGNWPAQEAESMERTLIVLAAIQFQNTGRGRK